MSDPYLYLLSITHKIPSHPQTFHNDVDTDSLLDERLDLLQDLGSTASIVSTDTHTVSLRTYSNVTLVVPSPTSASCARAMSTNVLAAG